MVAETVDKHEIHAPSNYFLWESIRLQLELLSYRNSW